MGTIDWFKPSEEGQPKGYKPLRALQRDQWRWQWLIQSVRRERGHWGDIPSKSPSEEGEHFETILNDEFADKLKLYSRRGCIILKNCAPIKLSVPAWNNKQHTGGYYVSAPRYRLVKGTDKQHDSWKTVVNISINVWKFKNPANSNKNEMLYRKR